MPVSLEGIRVADDDDPPPRPGYGDVEPAPVREEADAAAVVRPYGGEDDNLASFVGVLARIGSCGGVSRGRESEGKDK